MNARLGVAVLTKDNPQVVTQLLDMVRDVADCIVVGVDARVTPELLGPISDRADHLVRMQITGPDDITPAKWWLGELTACDWVLYLDTDEVLSHDLIDWIASFDRSCPITNGVAFTRRWVWPHGGSYLASDPWRDDPQLRLVRMHPLTTRCGRDLHETLLVAGGQRVQPQVLYHLDLVLTSTQERRRKATDYRAVADRPSPTPEVDFNTSFYLPEESRHSLRLAPIPENDQELIALMISAARAIPQPGPTPSAELVYPEQFRPHTTGKLSCQIEFLDPPEFVRADGGSRVPVLMTNTGDSSLLPYTGIAGIALGYNILCGNEHIVTEGRSPLNVPLAPGDSTVLFVAIPPCSEYDLTLSVGVVDERSAWITDRISLRFPCTND